MQKRGNRIFYERLDRQMPPNIGRYLVVPRPQRLLLLHQKRSTSDRFHIGKYLSEETLEMPFVINRR